MGNALRDADGIDTQKAGPKIKKDLEDLVEKIVSFKKEERKLSHNIELAEIFGLLKMLLNGL